MRYITIDNGIVTGLFAGRNIKIPKNGVEVKDLVGPYGFPINHYAVTDGLWRLKDTLALIREGIKPMPEGYQWNSDQSVIEPIPEPEPEPKPLTAEELIQQELAELHAYLNDTDYGVIKCMELGLIYANEYPTEHEQRTTARARINELEALINAENVFED